MYILLRNLNTCLTLWKRVNTVHYLLNNTLITLVETAVENFMKRKNYFLFASLFTSDLSCLGDSMVHDLVVVSLIPTCGKLSFHHVFAFYLISLWEKLLLALERMLCWYWCERTRKHMCVTNHHDVTLAVKVALNLNTINQLLQIWK